MALPYAESRFTIARIRLEGATIVLDAAGTAAQGHCPTCSAASLRVHGRYRRRPFDLPWRGQVVRFQLTVRRFRCSAPTCRRATFAEDIGPDLPRYARRTVAAARLLLELALAAGGEAGARLAVAAGLPASPDTLLRLLRRMAHADVSTPRVLGVDDFALRRGHRYGTILVDMETHRPLDLLADREAATLTNWLRAHPGVEIIVRDRAGAYAEGARAGAPDALQVADRFHLLMNASTALEELLRSRRRRTEWIAGPAPPAATAAPPVEQSDSEPAAFSRPAQRQRAERRERRIARWDEIRTRHAAGQNLSQIARAVGKDRKTVRRYLATPVPPPAPYVVRPRPAGLSSPTLQPFVAYLQDRWAAGCTNVRRLYGELVDRGYQGSYSLLRGALQPWRAPRPERVVGPRHRRSVRWLCLWPKEKLTAEELVVRQRVLAEDPELARACELREQFHDLVRAGPRRAGGVDLASRSERARALPVICAWAPAGSGSRERGAHDYVVEWTGRRSCASPQADQAPRVRPR